MPKACRRRQQGEVVELGPVSTEGDHLVAPHARVRNGSRVHKVELEEVGTYPCYPGEPHNGLPPIARQATTERKNLYRSGVVGANGLWVLNRMRIWRER